MLTVIIMCHFKYNFEISFHGKKRYMMWWPKLTFDMLELWELEELEELNKELRRLLELELELELFRAGSRIFFSLVMMVLPSGLSSSIMLISFRSFSAALAPTCTSTSSLSMAGPSATQKEKKHN